MDALFLICARGGSKGIPFKNIKSLNGKPLISYSIDTAREITCDQNICVSTDSIKIKEVVEDYGLKVPFIRPMEFALDASGMDNVILHALDYYRKNGKNYNPLVLLQPTSPLRTSKQIRDALNLFSYDLDMVVSVKESETNPYLNLYQENNEGLLKKVKSEFYNTRQVSPKFWKYNGAIYIINTEKFSEVKKIEKLTKVKKYLMDDISSIDIDNYFDFKLAEFIIKEIY